MLEGTAASSLVVVVQLVLALCVGALLPLSLVTLPGSPHRHCPRPARLNRREREVSLQFLASARWTRGLSFSAYEGLERVPTALAGVFVDRYDDTPIWGCVMCGEHYS